MRIVIVDWSGFFKRLMFIASPGCHDRTYPWLVRVRKTEIVS